MKKILTARQKEVLIFLKDFTADTGYPPTVRELADHFDMASPRGADKHLEALQSKGWITRTQGLSRGIGFIDTLPPAGAIVPIMGTVPAGPLDLAVEDAEESLILDPSLAGEDTFLLRVRGTSMIGDHIAPGDLVLVRKQQTAEDGDIVIAMIDEEATLKRFRSGRSGSPPRLVPSNPEYKAIILEERSGSVRITGKVQAVIRLMKGNAGIK